MSMSTWTNATMRVPGGRQRAYGSEYGATYDAALDGARRRRISTDGGLMRGLGQVAAGSLGAGLRAVGLGQATSTYGADPWGSGGTYAGRRLRGLGQATDDGTVAPPVDPATGLASTLNATGRTLAQVTVGVGAMAALGTAVSGAASGGLVGAVAGGRGNRMKYAGRGALAGAAIASIGATVIGGVAWASASQMATTAPEIEAVKSGAMTFTLANAALAVVEVAAIVLTKAAR